MDFTWVKRKDCKVLLQDSTLVLKSILDYYCIAKYKHSNTLQRRMY